MITSADDTRGFGSNNSPRVGRCSESDKSNPVMRGRPEENRRSREVSSVLERSQRRREKVLRSRLDVNGFKERRGSQLTGSSIKPLAGLCCQADDVLRGKGSGLVKRSFECQTCNSKVNPASYKLSCLSSYMSPFATLSQARRKAGTNLQSAIEKPELLLVSPSIGSAIVHLSFSRCN